MNSFETVVLSDLHLTEVHDPDPRNPLWMAYKQRRHFVDDDFAALLDHLQAEATNPLELVLNGDIFDFDSVTKLPEEVPEGSHVNWLARLRGLGSEEWMSLFKIDTILSDHPTWIAALSRFIRRGGRVVFVIGNHDVELHWPSVQQRVREAVGANSGSGERTIGGQVEDDRVVFCPWFYLSQGDTYISHGHLYDGLCSTETAIDPIISVAGTPRVRVPFGDLAGRYMLNGMGYFNPHSTDNYIKQSAWSYLAFWLRFGLRTQPMLLWTWFWGAMATLLVSMRDHVCAPMRDPLTVDKKVRDIARRSGVTPSMVRQLDALNEPSSCRNPVRLLRELWLDRGLLFFALLFAAWQIILHINVAWSISPWWVALPIALLLPPYLGYASSVTPTVFKQPLLTEERARLIAQITGAKRVVFGHTHVPKQAEIGPVQFFNAGFWSPAFATPECKERIGTQSFVWIRSSGDERHAALYEWSPGGELPAPYEPAASLPPTAPPVREAS